MFSNPLVLGVTAGWPTCKSTSNGFRLKLRPQHFRVRHFLLPALLGALACPMEFVHSWGACRRYFGYPARHAISREEAANVLGVGVDSPLEEVRHAFRKLAKAAHPDAGGSAEAFRELRDAFATLRRTQQEVQSSKSSFPHASEQEWEAW